MLKFVQKKLKEEKGLTLIELLAVIVILGIIAAIAIPAIGNIIENSKYNAVKSDALNALSAAQLLLAEDANALDDDKYTVKQLVEDGYLKDAESLNNSTTPIIIKSVKNKIVLDGTTPDFTKGKNVTFNDAGVTEIDKDNQKGSAEDSKTIPQVQESEQK